MPGISISPTPLYGGGGGGIKKVLIEEICLHFTKSTIHSTKKNTSKLDENNFFIYLSNKKVLIEEICLHFTKSTFHSTKKTTSKLDENNFFIYLSNTHNFGKWAPFRTLFEIK
jgi:hypothetical protein